MGGMQQMMLGGRPSWTPAQLANLFAWFDASDAASITHSSGAVSQWNDKSGNARHITQATGTAKPAYSATGLAGTQPGLTFDGGDHLANNAISLTANTLIHTFAVFRPTGTKLNNRVVSFGAFNGFDYQSVGYAPIVRSGSGDGWGSLANGVTGATVTLAGDQTAAIGTVRVDASNFFMSKNGAENSSSALGFPTAAQTRLTIGMQTGGGGGWLIGTVAEIIIIAGATPSTTERAAIQSYLAAKWTLT